MTNVSKLSHHFHIQLKRLLNFFSLSICIVLTFENQFLCTIITLLTHFSLFLLGHTWQASFNIDFYSFYLLKLKSFFIWMRWVLFLNYLKLGSNFQDQHRSLKLLGMIIFQNQSTAEMSTLLPQSFSRDITVSSRYFR